MTTVICASSAENDDFINSLGIAVPDAAVARYSAFGLGPTIAVAQALTFFTAVYVGQQPNYVIVVGDGPEMLAAALAAMFLRINVTHVDGNRELNDEFTPMLRDCIARIAGKAWAMREGIPI